MDSTTGGLFCEEAYLLYGPTGAGKTTFALGFLDQGARAGELVAMVTQRPPASVLSHAETMGYDLESHCRSGRMVLLEYPEEIYSNSTRVLTDARIIEEFRQAVGGEVSRLVLDPVTPLLSGLNEFQAARARTITEAFTGLGATTLLLVDTPQGADCLNACRDAVDGVLRFEGSPAADVPHALILERFRHFEDRQPQLFFGVSQGIGLVEQQGRLLPAPAESEGRGGNGPALVGTLSRTPSAESSGAALGRGDSSDARILVIHPERSARQQVHAILGSDYRITEANGAADGFARVGSETPDLIILGTTTRGVSASEFSRKLRHSGWNMPLLWLGDMLSRRADRIRALEAGADACLQLPLDGRVLVAQTQALLRRRTPTRLAHIPLVGPEKSLAPEWEDQGIRCTEDVSYFRRRLGLAIDYYRRCGAPFTLAYLRPHSSADDVQELAAVAAVTSRNLDLVLLGEQGAAILLPECESIVPYFDRLKMRWPAGRAPHVECAELYDSMSAEGLMNEVEEKVGGVYERVAAAVVAG